MGLCCGGAGHGLAAAQAIPPEASGERRTLRAPAETHPVGPPIPPACRFLQQRHLWQAEHVAFSSTMYDVRSGPTDISYLRLQRHHYRGQCGYQQDGEGKVLRQAQPKGAQGDASHCLPSWHAMCWHHIHHPGCRQSVTSYQAAEQLSFLKNLERHRGLTCDRLQQTASRGRVLRYQLLTCHEGAQLTRQARQACAVTSAHHHLVCLLQLVQRCCCQGWGSRNLSSLQ